MPATDAVASRLDRAIEAAIGWLLARQDSAGWWKGELQTNVTIDAEDLLLRQFLGIRGAAETIATATWIRSQQRDDGTWATFHGGPPDLSTTIEAYVALRLSGDPPDASHMVAAAEFVRAAGGIERSRVFTRIWLALFDQWSWEALPILPPEMIFLPTWCPLNIYDFGCWARQTIVPLTIVGSFRPTHMLGFNISELQTGAAPTPLHASWGWPEFFERVDALLHRYERRPIASLRRAALRGAEAWIVARQEPDGSWGGIQPPWVYSLIALRLLGYPLDHPVMRAGLAGLDGFVIDDANGRRLEACQSPVWDTALAVIALVDAGLDPGHRALARASSWLVDEEITAAGDWAVRRPGLQPSGWAFEFANDNYPDVDDSAEVMLAIDRAHCGDGKSVAAVERGRLWLEGMQSRDGGWGAFDVDNTRALCRQLPFCDFGELIDPPSADVTAHVVETLALLGSRGPVLDRGIAWLTEAQQADGSWFGRWGANHVYGTGAAVPALVAAGASARDPRIRRAIAWLERHQNDDGGWGEDLRSYDDTAWLGRGASTASQTAWALLALVAAGEAHDSTAQRGVAFLLTTQTADGTWDEPWFTGTGFPGDFYINYHLYRHTFPLMALGRYATALRRSSDVAADRSAPR